MTTLIMATGDLVLEDPQSGELLDAAAPTLQQADLVIGQLEVPHSDAQQVMTSDVPATPAPPETLDAVAQAGFHVMTLAGNHVFDLGGRGIADTRAHCLKRGLTPIGAGQDLEEAWEPAVIDAGQRQIKVLSVNCVGPKESWAGTAKPGCAAVNVITHYEPRGANPGGPPAIYTFAEPRSLAEFRRRIAAHRSAGVDVIVALHKGLVHQPADIADYEYEIARAAIDEGAVAVISHHAHILKGVEVYRGRPIFHGLGNFVTVTSALSDTASNSVEQRRWARERQRLFGFTPDPTMPNYPFHPESRYTAIAVLALHENGTLDAGLIPCWIADDARPIPQTQGGKALEIVDYICGITRDAGLTTDFSWTNNQLKINL